MSTAEAVTTKQGKLNDHIKLYIRPNNTKAFLAIAITLLLEAIAVALINSNLHLLGWVLHSFNLLRFFVQFHDMAHFSFFQSIPINKFVGHLFGMYTLFPFQMWRDGHNYHHKYFGNLDKIDLSQTILFNKKDYDSWSIGKKILVRVVREPVIFFAVMVQGVWHFAVLGNCIKKYGLFSVAVLEKLVSYIVFYVMYIYNLPALEYYICHHFAIGYGMGLFHLQHSVNAPYREHKEKWDTNTAALEGSTFLEVSPLLKVFTCGIEYHHIHHLNTNVASYNMQECHQKLQEKKGMSWSEFGINHVFGWNIVKSMNNVMLDEDKGVLTPFSYSSLE